MTHVRCLLPNASDSIDGVPFSPASDGRGMVSGPLDAETAARFLRIPGYEPAAAPEATPAPTPAAPSIVDAPPPTTARAGRTKS